MAYILFIPYRKKVLRKDWYYSKHFCILSVWVTSRFNIGSIVLYISDIYDIVKFHHLGELLLYIGFNPATKQFIVLSKSNRCLNEITFFTNLNHLKLNVYKTYVIFLVKIRTKVNEDFGEKRLDKNSLCTPVELEDTCCKAAMEKFFPINLKILSIMDIKINVKRNCYTPSGTVTTALNSVLYSDSDAALKNH